MSESDKYGRKSIKVNPPVKADLESLKKTFRLKTESEVIDFLSRFYAGHKGLLTIDKYEKLRQEVQNAHRQGSF